MHTRIATTTVPRSLSAIAKSIASVDNHSRNSPPSPRPSHNSNALPHPPNSIIISDPAVPTTTVDPPKVASKGKATAIIIPVPPLEVAPPSQDSLFLPATPSDENSSESEEEEEELEDESGDILMRDRNSSKASSRFSPFTTPGGLLVRAAGDLGARGLPMGSEKGWINRNRRNTRAEAEALFRDRVKPAAEDRLFTNLLGTTPESVEAMISTLQNLPNYITTKSYMARPKLSMMDYELLENPEREHLDYGYLIFAPIPDTLASSFIRSIKNYVISDKIHRKNRFYFEVWIRALEKQVFEGESIDAIRYAGLGGTGIEPSMISRPAKHFIKLKDRSLVQEQIYAVEEFNLLHPTPSNSLNNVQIYVTFLGSSPRQAYKTVQEVAYIEIAISTLFKTAIIQGGSNVVSTGMGNNHPRSSLCYQNSQSPLETIDSTLTNLEIPISHSMIWKNLQIWLTSKGLVINTVRDLWESWGIDYTMKEKEDRDEITTFGKLKLLPDSPYTCKVNGMFCAFELKYREWNLNSQEDIIRKLRFSGFKVLVGQLRAQRRLLPSDQFDTVFKRTYASFLATTNANRKSATSTSYEEFRLNLVDAETLAQGIKVWGVVSDASRDTTLQLHLYLKIVSAGVVRFIDWMFKCVPKYQDGKSWKAGAVLVVVKWNEATRSVNLFEEDGFTPVYHGRGGSPPSPVSRNEFKSKLLGKTGEEMKDFLNSM